MAPFITRASSSKADRGEEELLLELEVLNQALQSRRHTRSKSLASYNTSPLRPSELKRSSKHQSQPRPSFKVPFRSTSISCDRPRRLLTSNSDKHSRRHHENRKEEVRAHPRTEKEEDPQNCKEEGLHYFRVHETGHQYGNSSYKGRGAPQHSEKKGPPWHHQKKCVQCDQVHDRKGIWHWRPLRAISHIILSSHHRFNVLFLLQVQRIENLPESMNGLNLAVLWICKGHCRQTRASKIVNGVAMFGETLQHQCTIYSTNTSSSLNTYDAKPSTISVMAPDMDKLELSKHHVDLTSLLPQDDIRGDLWCENCHNASYDLLGMAKGGTLIATFGYNLVQKSSLKVGDGIRSLTKKRALLYKPSLPLSKDSPSLVSQPNASFSPGLLDSGAGAHVFQKIGHHNDSPRHTLLDSFMKEEAHETVSLPSDYLSDSFEFKPPLNQVLKDESSFSPIHFVTVTDDYQKYASTLHEENLPMTFPSNHTFHMHNESIGIEEEGGKDAHKLPEHVKMRVSHHSGPNWPPTPSFSFEEARSIRHTETDFDDDLDSVAEEFLNMLGIGFDSGHHNSEDDLESPRGKLLKQFEDDGLFVRAAP